MVGAYSGALSFLPLLLRWAGRTNFVLIVMVVLAAMVLRQMAVAIQTAFDGGETDADRLAVLGLEAVEHDIADEAQFYVFDAEARRLAAAMVLRQMVSLPPELAGNRYLQHLRVASHS